MMNFRYNVVRGKLINGYGRRGMVRGVEKRNRKESGGTREKRRLKKEITKMEEEKKNVGKRANMYEESGRRASEREKYGKGRKRKNR